LRVDLSPKRRAVVVEAISLKIGEHLLRPDGLPKGECYLPAGGIAAPDQHLMQIHRSPGRRAFQQIRQPAIPPGSRQKNLGQ
jgi:hypothetical protein